jgi:hypothetical protein
MKTFKTLAVLAVVTLMCYTAAAVPVSGGISLAGGYTTDTGDVNTANAFTAFNNVLVTSRAGSYAAVPVGQAVTQNAFTFDPFPGAGVTPLWTFTIGPTTYSFDLLTIQTPQQTGDNTLTLRGTGRLKITGFDNTLGSWLFTANQAGGTFSFSSSNAALPDGGTTIAMLGLALVGLGAIRRKLNM